MKEGEGSKGDLSVSEEHDINQALLTDLIIVRRVTELTEYKPTVILIIAPCAGLTRSRRGLL